MSVPKTKSQTTAAAPADAQNLVSLPSSLAQVPIPILDDSLRIALFLHLLTVAERGGDEGSDLLAAGFTPSQINALRGLTASSLIRVTDAIKRHLKLVIDVPGVLHALNTVQLSNIAAEQIVEMRSNGAPITMLQALFPTMRHMISVFDAQMRKDEAAETKVAQNGSTASDTTAPNSKKQRYGRTAAPPEPLYLLIANVWRQIGGHESKALDPAAWIRLRHVLMEEHNQEPLAVHYGVLWVAINEV